MPTSSFPPNLIRAFYYRQNSNFGDVLTPYLIKQIFGVHVHHSTFPKNCNFIGIGSVLEKIEEAPEDVTIWGAGFMWEGSYFKENYIVKKQNILAVRGKLSAARLIKKEDPRAKDFVSANGTVVGDPGLLITDPHETKQYELAFVPHYIDRSCEISNYIKRLPNVHYIDIMQESSSFIHELSKCKYVISSSLHGVIAADALGLPNLHVMLSDKVMGKNYKFRDYYSVFDQEHKCVDLRDINIRGLSTRRILNSVFEYYQPKTNLELIQDGLKAKLEEYLKERKLI